MSQSKILDLGRKLKALAEQGVGGEKVNAEEALARLMQKHNITIEDLDGIERQEERIRYPSAGGLGYKLARQIIASVIGSPFNKYVDKRNRLIYVKLSRAEYLEVIAKLDFFLPHYEKELETFYSAFIQVNHLYAKPDGKEDDRPLSDIDLAELERLMSMMQGMRPAPFLKRLDK
jgi:hypothetical protein